MSDSKLQKALDWWIRRDGMGGFQAAARELFPHWQPGTGLCKAPHRQEDKLPFFYITSHSPIFWHFKDRKAGTTGGLTAFVMLSGMDADAANGWLVEKWEVENESGMALNGGNAPSPREAVAGSLPATTGAISGENVRIPHAIPLSPSLSTSLTANGNAHHPSGIIIKDADDYRRVHGPGSLKRLRETAVPVLLPPPEAPAENPWGDALGAAIVSSCELQTMALPARPKLLGDWFCEGDLGFIFAFRGVGKTWLGLLMARALSEGGRLGEWQAPAPARTLYVDGEMPPDLMRQRDHGLARASATGNLEFLNHEILFRRTHRVMNITQPDVQRAILGHCERTGVKVLILDNLSTLASGMKENDADDWDMVGRWLLDFRRRQIAVVVIHHAGRNGEMRGTTKREDDAGWIVALDDARQSSDDRRGARFISRFSKQTRNTPEEIPPYEWHICPDPESGLISVTYTLAQGCNQLRKLIEEGITDCTELAEELKVSKGTISKWAHKGISEGWLMKEGRAYALRKSE